MADNGDFKLQISYKLGPNYADMLNVRADDAYELDGLLIGVRDHLVPLVTEVGELLRAAGNVAPLTVPQPHVSLGGQTPAMQASDIPPTNAPSGQGTFPKSCPHGLMTFREGVSARGAWKGYFCPLPKGAPGQCKAEFLK